ncbi:hypothetical protein LX32DRAFT_109511 [Colletotrichum zoysiae]|uniref:Secreted protein n=1 Tax=Colletotrichum zoysiae TaxID=1216348 RepID=A0AAD9LZV8_9PEZI|nr:hypothetical protein LX32DRAFT_109511 [Colletotrichum zoysiae]
MRVLRWCVMFSWRSSSVVWLMSVTVGRASKVGGMVDFPESAAARRGAAQRRNRVPIFVCSLSSSGSRSLSLSLLSAGLFLVVTAQSLPPSPSIHLSHCRLCKKKAVCNAVDARHPNPSLLLLLQQYGGRAQKGTPESKRTKGRGEKGEPETVCTLTCGRDFPSLKSSWFSRVLSFPPRFPGSGPKVQTSTDRKKELKKKRTKNPSPSHTQTTQTQHGATSLPWRARGG